MPDDLGGGFVTGELLAPVTRGWRFAAPSDPLFPTGDGNLSAGFGPWEELTWWEGEADPERAAIVLHHRGYTYQLDPADLGSSSSGNAPGESLADG